MRGGLRPNSGIFIFCNCERHFPCSCKYAPRKIKFPLKILRIRRAIEGLKSEDRFSLTDALAILITKRDKLDYDKLLRLAEREGVTRKLGCVLEMINYEAGREMFPTREIAEIQRRTDTSYLTSFPKTIETAQFAEEEKEHYMDIGKRWNMKIYLSKAFVSKIVTDLVR